MKPTKKKEIMKFFQKLSMVFICMITLAACTPTSTIVEPTVPPLPTVPLPATPIVATQLGAVQGVVADNVAAFKGIPFAQPPVGDLRWRAPQPATPWQGTRMAEEYGRACMQPTTIQIDDAGELGPVSEDCLYLNVWTPNLDAAAKLPVMVWIHGGAFTIGSGGVVGYDGTPQAGRGAVVVNINYRLGQLGFFAHPALAAEAPDGPANFGLLDQIAALTWVQQNIAQFGGDPGNITIFGQSAGGKSVLALFASPLARGLFHKGIAQSSYVLPDATLTKALELGVGVADAVNLNGAAATTAELRAVPAEAFAALPLKMTTSPVSISGDSVMPQSIEATFRAGEEARLPLIVGNASDEASIATAFGVDPVDLLKRLGGAGIFVKALYPGVSDERQLALQATRDVLFTMPVRWIADRHARFAPTWRYYFDYTAVNDRPNFPNGVPHGNDVAYFMNTGDLYPSLKDIFTDEDRAFAQQASEYWFEFARTGEPSATSGPEWLSGSVSRDKTMYFGETTALRTDFMRARLNVLINVVKIIDAIAVRK